MSLTLIIGNKNYSSWSLRPWLLMKHAGLDFREIVIPLYRADSRAAVLEYSPTGKVPALIDGDLHMWDSLAICEHIAEKTGFGWPKQPGARALARSVSAEMHSGFQSLREQCPMNVRARKRVPRTADLARDVERAIAVWSECRDRYGAGGPWLFGSFTIADAMYAPVALRFNSYTIDVPAGTAAAYVATVAGDRYVADWRRAAQDELWLVEDTERVGEPV